MRARVNISKELANTLRETGSDVPPQKMLLPVLSRIRRAFHQEQELPIIAIEEPGHHFRIDAFGDPFKTVDFLEDARRVRVPVDGDRQFFQRLLEDESPLLRLDSEEMAGDTSGNGSDLLRVGGVDPSFGSEVPGELLEREKFHEDFVVGAAGGSVYEFPR